MERCIIHIAHVRLFSRYPAGAQLSGVHGRFVTERNRSGGCHKMLSAVKTRYRIRLNQWAGIVEQLACRNDPPDTNLVHRDEVSAFGSLSLSSREEPWRLEDTGSPIGIRNYVFDEKRYFAGFDFREGDRYFFRNECTGHQVVYELQDDSFSIRVRGVFPDADQIALDVNPAFIDLRQNDPISAQFTVKSFYASEDRSLCYVYLARCGGNGGILIHSTDRCAAWRLRYGKSPSILGLQMIFRFSREILPEEENGAEINIGVSVSFHDDLAGALKFLAEKEGVPLICAPLFSGMTGTRLAFRVVPADAEVRITDPSGGRSMRKFRGGRGDVQLAEEGFYRLLVRGAGGKTLEAVFHAHSPCFDILERVRQAWTPYFRSFNAENQCWVQAMTLAHQWLGYDKRMTDCLHDFLMVVGRQGRENEGVFPYPPPSAESTRRRIEKRRPGREHYLHDGRYFIDAPSPVGYEMDGEFHPAGHIYKYHRIQDGFAYVETYLYAAEAFHCDAFYEDAVKIAEAHLKAHQRADGAIMRYGWRGKIDYTTVIAPLLSLSLLYREMCRRNDSRAGRMKECILKGADYLLRRGMEFPTEGVPVHLRWTEDGSISCTALSLLAVCRYVENRSAYLKRAEEILRFHDAWHIETFDARSCDTTFRYWETQWENEGEGHSINCGHGWNLWRGTAMFYYAVLTENAEAFRESFNTFQAVLCNFHPDGRVTSCFTPDYLPRRPLRKELYHCYPPEAWGQVMPFYIWPRLRDTWFRTVVVFDDPAVGTTAVNGKLEDEGDGVLSLIPFAPFPESVYLLTSRKDRIRIRREKKELPEDA